MKTMKGFMIVFAMVAGMLFVSGCGAAPGGGSFSASIAVDHNTTSLRPDDNVTITATVTGGEAKSFSWADNNTTIKGETEAKLVYHITAVNIGTHVITVKVVATDGSEANASVTLKTITADEAKILAWEERFDNKVADMIAQVHWGQVKVLTYQDGVGEIHGEPVGGDKQSAFDEDLGKMVLGDYPCTYTDYGEPASSTDIPGNFDYMIKKYLDSDGNYDSTYKVMHYCSDSLYDVQAQSYYATNPKRYNQGGLFFVKETESDTEYLTLMTIYSEDWPQTHADTDRVVVGAVVYTMGLSETIYQDSGTPIKIQKKLKNYNGQECIQSVIVTEIAGGLITDSSDVKATSHLCPNQSIVIDAMEDI